MSRWMINARGHQFSAGSMEELKQLARRGELSSGDIVQPPGAAEWIYALEVPELKGSLRADVDFELEGPAAAKEMSPAVKWGSAAALALLAVGAWSYALSLRATIPQPGDLELIGKKGLSFSEVLVTADNGQLRAEASDGAAAVSPLPKNQKAELLAKRGKWYKLRYEGKEGYAKVDEVIPAYFFGDEKTKAEHDPLYNPDRYVFVANGSGQILNEGGKNVTVFSFLIQNNAKFAMTDLKLLATIRDKNDQVLETKEIALEGKVPPEFSTMVGVLSPDKKDKTGTDRILTSVSFEELSKADPTIVDRWQDGVGVQLSSSVDVLAGAEAAIDILEVRAVPAEEAAK